MSKSLRNIALVTVTFFLVILLWKIRALIVVLMISAVLAATLAPIVDYGEKKLNLPRWLGVILTYLSIISIATVTGLLIGPTVITQIQKLLQKFPLYLDILNSLTQSLILRVGITEPQVLDLVEKWLDLQVLVAWTARYSQRIILSSLDLTRLIATGLFNGLLSIIFSGYMLSGSHTLIRDFASLFPAPWDLRIQAQFGPVSDRMGKYIQGRLLVSFILGITVSIGLRVIGISEFALGLGVIAGITNLIPFFGPVLGLVPALIVAIAQGGFTFGWVLLLFLIIQNLETYVLDPLLVGSSVKVPPLYQLLAVLGGVQVLGILGALIVPPWVAGVGVVIENLYLKPKQLESPSLLTIDSAENN